IFLFCLLFFFFFFFSSRRRHTRWTGDWSSDVCSSDLIGCPGERRVCAALPDGDPSLRQSHGRVIYQGVAFSGKPQRAFTSKTSRSEERRVGKECRSRG